MWLMDPITGAVVAIVLFLVSIPAVWLVIPMLLGVLSDLVADPLWGFLAGSLIALAWSAYATIQVILQVIQLVGLLQ